MLSNAHARSKRCDSLGDADLIPDSFFPIVVLESVEMLHLFIVQAMVGIKTG